eukprot:g6047.t1
MNPSKPISARGSLPFSRSASSAPPEQRVPFSQPIVIATGNPHKIDEIRAVLSPIGVGVVGLSDLPGAFEEPVEGKDSFIENATLKATSYARQTGRVCLADDSGLEVDALGGAPGVISSHYATDGEETGLTREQRDSANNARLLADLEGVAPEDRTARFVCTMVLAAPLLDGASTLGWAGILPAPDPAASSPYQGDFKTHQRRLPHWQLGGATYFVTWRLQQGELDPEERLIVLDACRHWDGSLFSLHAACVMPDHVHLLFRITQLSDGSWPELPKIVHSIKSYSSNVIQDRRGEHGALWQREYFDRIVRDSDEAQEKFEYILMNPVKAGLVDKPGLYPFAFAPEGRQDAGPTKTRVLATVRGAFEGRIGLPGDVPRGDNGFGYDPLVLMAPDFRRTGAELLPEEKNARSHRGEAARAMAIEIQRLKSAQ